ncbi:MAG: class I adenylate-forming enzyme family protein [Ahrensia sp.]|nr:class I adenylate-forming enzyme family protein [Ahrensia sp.]
MTARKFNRLYELLCDKAHAAPNDVGLIDIDGTATTYGEWESSVQQTAKQLRESGLRPGDRMMLIAENCAAYVIHVFAAWHCGAWVMPVNARMSDGEIDRLVAHAQPRLIVATSAASQPARNHAQRLGASQHADVAIASQMNVKQEPVFDGPDEQVAALMYTTGTTGDPKGVMLSHASLEWYARVSSQFRDMTPADHAYCPLPLTHIYGFGNALLGNLCAGAKLELALRFDCAATFDAIERGATVLPAVPAMYAHLLDYAQEKGWQKAPPNRLRYIMTGGAPLDPDWKRRVEAFFDLPLNNGYGMTECSPGIASSKGIVFDPAKPDDVSCGPPLPDLEVRIVPPPGQDCLADGVGEIVVRGPNIMLGYYKNPQATAQVLEEDGTFHTGDLGHFDDLGRLHLDGRCKELIIRSGFNVYPPEVEAALTKHPAVTLAAVIGRKVPGNEEVLAFVQRVPSADVREEELVAFLKDEIAPYKRPSRIIIVDALPVSSANKVFKHKLINQFADRLN